MSKAEELLIESAEKNMFQWDITKFQKTHSTLYKTVIYAIDKALDTNNTPRIMPSIWVFFYEDEEDKPQFKVEAKTQWEAYSIAEDSFGPQVEDMIYKMI